MSNYPIKATSNDSCIIPFYLIQKNGKEQRYVVSLQDKLKIRIFIAGFINQSTDFVEVKIRIFDDQKNQIDYSGSIDKLKLHQLITTYEDVIFHNGYHDFMMRIPEKEEYFVFDEHGLIFLYTKNDYKELLKNIGAEYKPNGKLIYQFDHWHYCLPNGKEKLIDFIRELKLVRE